MKKPALKETAPSKTKRPSREQRLDHILTAAREVFEQQGYEKATVAEIAEKIGVVEGTIFTYFSSKRVLVLKVMEQFYEEITLKIEAGIKGVEGTRNQLYYVIWSHLSVVADNAAICAVILRESRGLDQTLSDEVHELNRRYTRVVLKVVKDGIAAGDIRADVSPSLVRNTLFGSVEHYLWDMVTGHSAGNIEALAEQLTNLVFSGIANRDVAVDKADVNRLIKQLSKLL